MSIKEKRFLIIYFLESTLYFMISNNISYAFSPKRYVKYCFSDSPIQRRISINFLAETPSRLQNLCDSRNVWLPRTSCCRYVRYTVKGCVALVAVLSLLPRWCRVAVGRISIERVRMALRRLDTYRCLFLPYSA